MSANITYLGIADELDAVLNIQVDVEDVDLRSEAIVCRHQSEVVLGDASEQMRSANCAVS